MDFENLYSPILICVIRERKKNAICQTESLKKLQY